MKKEQTIINLQIARFVAAMLVLFSHVQHEAQKPSVLNVQGYQPWDFIYFAGGVDIFFIISGFIMYHIAQKEFGRPGAAMHFIVRRLLRVVAPYWICTTAMVVAAIIFRSHVTHSELSLAHIMASYFFIPYENAYSEIYPVLMLGWTLNFEMLFYVIFAISLNFNKSVGPWVLASVISLIGLLDIFTNIKTAPFAFWVNTIVFEFLMGVVLAIFWAKGFRWSKTVGFILAIFGFVAMYYLKKMGIAEHYWTARPLWMGLPALAICAAAVFTRENNHTSQLSRAMVFGGDISYALYLSHPFALNLLFLVYVQLGFRDVWIYVWTASAFSLLVAVLFHGWVEKPVTQYLQQSFSKKVINISGVFNWCFCNISKYLVKKKIDGQASTHHQLLSLQYLRGFAALLVVWQHAVYKMPMFLPSSSLHTGAVGVAIFFVISGFVMQMTTDGKQITAFEFFKRRFIRVVPLYWIITLLMALLLLIRNPALISSDVSPERIIKSIFFIPHFSPGSNQQIWPIVVPGWTLNYEMFFYLMFAVSMIFKSRLRVLSTIFIGLVIVGAIFEPFQNPLMVTYTHPLFLEFLAGMIIYRLWKNRQITPSIFMSILLIGIGLFCVFQQGEKGYFDYSRLLGSALIVLGCLNASVLSWRNDLLLKVGNASYSIYLSHILVVPLVYGVIKQLPLHLDSLLTFSLYILFSMVASIVIGHFVYRLVEMPLLVWMKRHFLKKDSVSD
jgi:exopolysaccharide production protein ExoZ